MLAVTTRTDSPDGFMRLGAEYYLAGRFAFLQRCRISANLFHHSVELFLKYDLLTDVPEAARRKYGHDLDRLWADFKDRDTSRIALARFDKVVAGLDDWEHLRYGSYRTSETSGKGVAQTMTFMPQRVTIEPSYAEEEVDEYVLCLEDVDDLVAVIVTSASINPAVLFLGLSPEALDWYSRDNRHALAEVPPNPSSAKAVDGPQRPRTRSQA
jgi:hypothetical protein